MAATLKCTATVQAGHRIEITAPGFPEGSDVEVMVKAQADPGLDDVSRRFVALASQWRSEARALSSVTQMSMHPAYQEIIGMGRDVIPLILEAIRKEPDHWFWALRAITGEDPIQPQQRGLLIDMANAWFHWGRQRGLVE